MEPQAPPAEEILLHRTPADPKSPGAAQARQEGDATLLVQGAFGF